MAETAVVNTSPLILLARAGRLDLLRLAAATVWVPEPVADEVRAGCYDAAVRALSDTEWLTIVCESVAGTGSSLESRTRRGGSHRVCAG